VHSCVRCRSASSCRELWLLYEGLICPARPPVTTGPFMDLLFCPNCDPEAWHIYVRGLVHVNAPPQPQQEVKTCGCNACRGGR